MVLVTGATGLVGGHLLVQLWKAGFKLRATCRPHSQYKELKWISFYYSIEWETFYNSIDWVIADLLNCDSLREAMQGIDTVYHCAAVVAFHPEYTELMTQTNIEGTRNICQLALETNVKHFGMISSIAAISDATDGTDATEESGDGREGGSNYSMTKSISEQIVWSFIGKGLPAFIVNPGVILGVGLPNKGSLKLVNSIFKFMPFYTTGGTGYVDVEDVCRAMMICTEKEVKASRFILVSENISYRQLFTQLARKMRVAPPLIYAPNWVLMMGFGFSKLIQWVTGQPQMLTKETIRSAQQEKRYSSNKIKTELGFEFIPIDRTLQVSADWCVKYHSFQKKWFQIGSKTVKPQ